MDTNEEMIEEINEVEESKSENLDDTVVLDDISKIDNVESNSENSDLITDEAVEEYIKAEGKKKKKLIIAILTILLVFDIAALVIYMIGVDKVIGFIK